MPHSPARGRYQNLYGGVGVGEENFYVVWKRLFTIITSYLEKRRIPIVFTQQTAGSKAWRNLGWWECPADRPGEGLSHRASYIRVGVIFVVIIRELGFENKLGIQSPETIQRGLNSSLSTHFARHSTRYLGETSAIIVRLFNYLMVYRFFTNYSWPRRCLTHNWSINCFQDPLI